MSGAVVFLGPTLPRAEAARLLPGALLLPPARQGDVFRAVRAHAPSAIGLVDGAFLDVPAVWHRELLWALQGGVSVLGAASMGALRAAELHPFGMHGVGVVFEAYRGGTLPGWDGPFEDDDEVAVIHAPPEAGGMALSDAMVDLRHTLARAEAAGEVDRSTRDAIAAMLKAMHFPERSVARLQDAARAAGTPALASWIGTHHASCKAEDARAMLRAMGSGKHPPAQPFRMERALVWERFAADALAETPRDAAVLDRLALDQAEWRKVAVQAVGRAAALDRLPPGDAKLALDAFRRTRGLLMRQDVDGWCEANGLGWPGLERLLGDEAALDAAGREDGRLRGAMLDILRLSGQYEALDRKVPG